MGSRTPPSENKFHAGAADGRHYWLTPPDLYAALDAEFAFDFDPCPHPLADGFDGLSAEWGRSSYVNPPFGSILHDGRRKGMTAWVRKALAEHAKGKRVVMVYPLDKWVLMLLAAGAQVRNLGDVRWLATEDHLPGKGTGRHIACFVLDTTPSSLGKPPIEQTEEAATPLAGGSDYDANADMAGSYEDCLRAVRERVAAGGKGWGGWPPEGSSNG